MEAIIALAVCFAFSSLCADLLKKVPVVFYFAFIVLGALFASGVMETYAPALNMALIPYLRRASLAFGLFTVVMFVGVFPEGNQIRKRLTPVRGTLSLIGFVLVLVHVVGYATTYWVSVTNGAANPWIACGFIIGIVASVLLVALSITSVPVVRRTIGAHLWKNIQKLAYPFYLLMYAHLAAMLAPSSLMGGNSLDNFIVYTVVVVAYFSMRLLRAKRDQDIVLEQA